MSALLDSYLDTLRRSDCMRNDEAIRVGAPVRPAGFECVEVRTTPVYADMAMEANGDE